MHSVLKELSKMSPLCVVPRGRWHHGSLVHFHLGTASTRPKKVKAIVLSRQVFLSDTPTRDFKRMLTLKVEFRGWRNTLSGKGIAV